MNETRVVIVGGGFGGVYAARALLRMGLNVTLISKTNFFVFTPLLHEVATGSLRASDITFEYSDFFNKESFTFYREEVVSADFDKQIVITADGEVVQYDYLVIATGARTNFFDIAGSEHAFGLKSIEDALGLKKKVVSLAQGIERDIAVNVVGGGPTGVELAFELEEFLREIKKRSKSVTYQVRMIHSGDTLCPTFPESIQKYAYEQMQMEGIEVRLETTVSEITPDGIATKQGEYIEGELTVWTAGVVAETRLVPDEYKDERGRVVVDSSLAIRGRQREFAVGDVIVIGEEAIPQLAQTASRQGSIVAKNIKSSIEGVKGQRYKHSTSGALISLGKGRGAGTLFGLTFKGFIGWCIWRGAYISKIPGARNKGEVLFTWFTNLFFSRDLFER